MVSLKKTNKEMYQYMQFPGEINIGGSKTPNKKHRKCNLHVI